MFFQRLSTVFLKKRPAALPEPPRIAEDFLIGLPPETATRKPQGAAAGAAAGGFEKETRQIPGPPKVCFMKVFRYIKPTKKHSLGCLGIFFFNLPLELLNTFRN